MVKTRPQLLNLLLAQGWGERDLHRVERAHELARRLFAGAVRPDGQPFLDHLVGTAGAVVDSGGDAELCAAALLHSAYPLGDFGDGTRGVTGAKRAEVREAVGPEVEELVAEYAQLRWTPATMRALAGDVASLPEPTRRVVVLRVANALDDHRDLGMRYRGRTPSELRDDPEIPLLVTLAAGVGCADLGDCLRRAVDDEIATELPPSLQTGRADCYSVRPRSTRLRLRAWLRAEESPTARGLHRALWRARRAVRGR